MSKRWFKLDNAAKIFPPTSNKKDPKVFRFVCTLKENIDCTILQRATIEALDLFPSFRSVLKHGMFWYYLEMTNNNPKVKEENKPLCFPIYTKNKKRLLFRVSYFKKRINLEVYHALSDGVGALEFLKTIVYLYLCQKYQLDKDLTLLENAASLSEKSDDSFNKYYKFQTFKKKKTKSAYRVKGIKLADYRLQVLTGYMKTKDMLTLAHKYDTTLTGLILAVFIYAFRKNMTLKEQKKPLCIDMPVNLRKYFASSTSRNFFSVLKLDYHLESNDFETMIKFVKTYLEEEINENNLFIRMNSFATLEHNLVIRVFPLFIKNAILKFSNFISKRHITSSVSNLGVIKVPKVIEDYVENFEAFVSTNKLQVCICSYLDTLTISFTSIFVDTDIIKDFYRKLSELGIDIVINASRGDI
ncbi:MAG: hypothetical protein RSB71_02095 [Bacilli bacterium]